MKSISIALAITVIGIPIVTAGFVEAGEITHERNAIELSGGELQALIVAREAFLITLTRYSKRASDIDRHLSFITNYTARIGMNEKGYVVDFFPANPKSGPIKGGGGRYEISADAFRIVSGGPTR